MDSKELRSLQEAYLEVYQVDEAKQESDEEDWRKSEIRNLRRHRQTGTTTPYTDRIVSHAKGRGVKKERGSKVQREETQIDEIIIGGKLNKKERLAMTLEGFSREEIDLYDTVFTHLLDEGYADTEEAAHKIAVHMSEEWIETIVESEPLAKKGGVEGVGTGANWRAKAWSKAEKSRFTNYKKPTASSAPAAKSSEDAPKASAPAAAPRPRTTKHDVALYKLQSADDRRDFERQAMAAGKSPVQYARQQSQRAADAKPASADEKQRMYWDAKNRADDIQSWHKFRDKGYSKKWADTNYRQNLAMRNNDPKFDPTKTEYPDLPKGALLKYDRSGKEVRK